MAFERIVLHLTDRCQLNCDHCLRDPELKPTDLSVTLLGRVLDDMQRLYGTPAVAFTGGEPTLHPDFDAFVLAAAERGMRWSIVTNGIHLDRVLGRLAAHPGALEACERIAISVDGATEETHDAIRGRGSFRAVLSAHIVASSMGIPTRFHMTINQRNAHEVEALALLASDMGVPAVLFEGVQATGTFLDRGLYLTPTQLRALREQVEALDAMLAIDVRTANGFVEAAPYTPCEPFDLTTLSVESNGDVRFCAKHAGIPGKDGADDTIGNLNEISVAEAVARVVGVVGLARRRRVAAIADGAEGWAACQCNTCLRDFGRPFWQDAGEAGGPQAKRERWRGAWAPKENA
jgi:MoaA/NifB/PqqE/SkfB family radical SAM enzyme